MRIAPFLMPEEASPLTGAQDAAVRVPPLSLTVHAERSRKKRYSDIQHQHIDQLSSGATANPLEESPEGPGPSFRRKLRRQNSERISLDRQSGPRRPKASNQAEPAREPARAPAHGSGLNLRKMSILNPSLAISLKQEQSRLRRMSRNLLLTDFQRTAGDGKNLVQLAQDPQQVHSRKKLTPAKEERFAPTDPNLVAKFRRKNSAVLSYQKAQQHPAQAFERPEENGEMVQFFQYQKHREIALALEFYGLSNLDSLKEWHFYYPAHNFRNMISRCNAWSLKRAQHILLNPSTLTTNR